MLCYKDKSFCGSDCTNQECHRFLSPAVRVGARRWWYHDPDNAPIATVDFSGTCPVYKPPS